MQRYKAKISQLSIKTRFITSISSTNCQLYNVKELKDEVTRLRWYDYGARIYDPQLGRWWVMDPMTEVARNWSPYAYCYNNSIRYIDPTGMIIEEGSKREWESQKEYVENLRNKLQTKVDKLTAKAETKGWSAEKLANKIGDKKERITSLNTSLETMGKLETSSQVYSLSYTVPGKNGGVILNTETNVININFGSTANFIHEITHAGQFETGDLAFDSKTGNPLGQDVYDEVSAYRAQFAYKPSSVSELTSTSVANSFETITASWVQGLAGGSLYVPIGSPNYIPGVSANTGVAPLDINSGKQDFINAYPNYMGFKAMPQNYILKYSYPNIYYKLNSLKSIMD